MAQFEDLNRGACVKGILPDVKQLVVQASGLLSSGATRSINKADLSLVKAGETPAPQACPAIEFTDPRTTPFVEPRSRGHLPHLYKEGGSYFVTFRLWDAVAPQAGETPAPQKKRKTREEVVAESEPPLQLGSCMLANPDIAKMVQDSIKHFHGERYYLHAWCVMCNHLHVVYTAMCEHAPSKIHHSWKSFTAHKANKLLRRSGAFWESEAFDHLIRSVEDLEWFIEYVENNPTTAGLCDKNEKWPYSSAGTYWNNPQNPCGAGVPPATCSQDGCTTRHMQPRWPHHN